MGQRVRLTAHRKPRGKPGFHSLLRSRLTPRWGFFYCSQTRADPHAVSFQEEAYWVPRKLDQSVPSRQLGDLVCETAINEEWSGQIWGCGRAEDQMTSRSLWCPVSEEAGLVGFPN